MFSVEIKVNGSIIAHLYGHNKGPATNEVAIRHDASGGVHIEGDICEYEYEYYELGMAKRGTGQILRGEVEHNRNESMIVLLQKIFDEVEKKRKKK